MNLVNCLDSVQMVHPGINANLVHDNNAGGTSLRIKGTHSRRDITGGDDVGLSLDSGFDDGGVISVRNEGDDEVMGSYCLLESGSVVNVQGDSGGNGKVSSQSFSRLECTA